MKTVSVVLFSLMLCSAHSAPLKVIEESNTIFLGEDFHIYLPSLGVNVTYRASSPLGAPEVVLMRGGVVVGERAKLNLHLSHLILDNVVEGDEGVYTVKNSEASGSDRRITLIVRDCSNEENVLYGGNYDIQLLGVTGPITLEYRPSAVEANQTSSLATVLMSEGVPIDSYQGRLSVTERHLTLNGVVGTDEGSYTIKDTDGKIKRKVCLNVKEHQNFVKVPYAGTLKINLLINSSMARLLYTPQYDFKTRLILDKGELTIPADLGLEGRISLDGSVCVLEEVKSIDIGQFQVTDQHGFPVSNIYLDVMAYRLPTVYVAIIALVGLLVFLLLVCLLSCLFKVKKRAEKARAIEKIAQNAGKDEGADAFRQVVKDITHFNEESMAQSQADHTEKSQSTEVDIKGLEVSSKEGREGANLETSDSGVEFNTTGLPLDTDTDAPDQMPDSEAESVAVALEIKPSLTPVAETKPSPTPETKPSPVPEKSPEPALEPMLTVTKSVDTKSSPVQTPEPKPAPSPVSKLSPSDGLDSKTPELKPAVTPDPKPTAPLSPASKPAAPQPPEPKPAVTPTPEPPKPSTPEPAPTTNGTPEPAPESKPTKDSAPYPTDLIEGSAQKPTPPKTPEVEVTAVKDPPLQVNSSSPALEAKIDTPASNDSAPSEDTAATTTT